MSEQRIIDANVPREKLCKWLGRVYVSSQGGQFDDGTGEVIADCVNELDKAPTIDPETLPIVKELRENIDNLCEFLCYATNGKLSKSNYTAEEMKVAFDDCVKLECDNCGMESEIKELREKLARYEQAEKEGRLAFLDEPMIPTVRSDDPMDFDVYCPACGYDLSGGWNESPADEYHRMYQCPNCGQSVNDMACISREAAEAILKERDN